MGKELKKYSRRSICNLITQIKGQSESSIAYFWKSRLLVTLAEITHSIKYTKKGDSASHNKSKDPDSIPIDFSDCYDDDTREKDA